MGWGIRRIPSMVIRHLGRVDVPNTDGELRLNTSTTRVGRAGVGFRQRAARGSDHSNPFVDRRVVGGEEINK